ncbi:MAG: hypothetical protein HZA51_09265 [Planctomycetes bacterium]|nr:hypothetical protein [Planctomycetota bacterium]
MDDILLAIRLGTNGTPTLHQRRAPTDWNAGGVRRSLSTRMDRCVDEPLRRFGLDTLSQMLGIPFVVTNASRPDLYYGFDPLIGRSARVWIRAERSSDWSHRPPAITMLSGVPVVFSEDVPRTLVDRNRIEFDLILATAYWVSLTSERHSSHRDAHGRVPALASVLGQHDLTHRPPVHAYAALVSRMFGLSAESTNVLPRWPDGKQWAALLTHDVDLPERAPLARSFVKEFLRPRNIRRRDALYALRAEVARFGLRESLINGPTRRKEWDFARLCDLQREANLRSAFYFATINRRDGHPCDVDYDIDQTRYGNLIRSLSSDGFEIGLHASYCTVSEGPDVSVQLAKMPPAALPITGVRHHYLQLNHADPMSTLIDHSDARLRYDSSIGFNDAPGFRAGLAMPFHPFDATCSVRRDFVELPMTLADMHLPTHDAAAGIQIVRKHLECVRGVGGLAVLNWHVGHSMTHPGWRAGLIEAIELLRQDSSVWTPTPSEMAEWWIERTAAMDRAAERFDPLDASSDVLEWPQAAKSTSRVPPSTLAAGRVPVDRRREYDLMPLAESA